MTKKYSYLKHFFIFNRNLCMDLSNLRSIFCSMMRHTLIILHYSYKWRRSLRGWDGRENLVLLSWGCEPVWKGQLLQHLRGSARLHRVWGQYWHSVRLKRYISVYLVPPRFISQNLLLPLRASHMDVHRSRIQASRINFLARLPWSLEWSLWPQHGPLRMLGVHPLLLIRQLHLHSRQDRT